MLNGGGASEDAGALYQASQTKRRPTKAEVIERRERLYKIVLAGKPMTVRQVYYRAEVLGMVGKDEAGYNLVQRELSIMRDEGTLPFNWIVDLSRSVRKPYSCGGVAEALRDLADGYRLDVWRKAPCRVQMWCEKEALTGVLWPVTARYDVPLFVAKGFSSKTFLHDAATDIAATGVPHFIYHLGDFDPSGVEAGKQIEERLREYAPNAEIHFERLAVTISQIADWSLPTRETKQSDTRAKKFGYDFSCELDAIDPAQLRELVADAITEHLPGDLDQTIAWQEADRQEIQKIASEMI